jgi:hypothetical protein
MQYRAVQQRCSSHRADRYEHEGTRPRPARRQPCQATSRGWSVIICKSQMIADPSARRERRQRQATADAVLRERSVPTTLKVSVASYGDEGAHDGRGTRGGVSRPTNRGLVHLHRVLRQGAVRRQSRTAARHRREGARLATSWPGSPARPSQSLPHAADHGRLRPGSPRTGRARSYHAEGHATGWNSIYRSRCRGRQADHGRRW